MTLGVELDSFVEEVGGVFTGRVSRLADADGTSSESKARAVRMELRYWTEGRGDTDNMVISNVEFPIEPHGGLQADFRLAVPQGAPISYDGSLIRVLYEIEARVDLKLARDPKVTRAVLVVPVGGLGTYDRPHPLPVDPSRFNDR